MNNRGTKRLVYFIKCLIFITLLCACIFQANKILRIKGLEARLFSPLSTFNGFYQMDENSIDVLFIGSSHSYTSFSPQQIYNEYGIRSYNLGSSAQHLLLSYYWLEEALKYQTPRCVVLETYKAGYPNVDDAAIRKGIDYMRMSETKIQAINDINTLIPDISPQLSFYFPNIRYHERWKELTADDFQYFAICASNQLKGYAPLRGQYNNNDYAPLSNNLENIHYDLDPIAEKYLDKIATLCKEKGIDLILIKTPTTVWNEYHHAAVASFAKLHNIDFYDLNLEKFYSETNCNFSSDYQDIGHPNVYGATKLSNYIGKLLRDTYAIPSMLDEQWEKTKNYYSGILKDMDIKVITNLEKYFTYLNDSRYTIFISVKGNSFCNNPTLISAFKSLGLDPNVLLTPNASYTAVIQNGIVSDAFAQTASVESFCSFRNGLSQYKIMSAGTECGNSCSIKIDNIEYAKKQNGLNIVIYNNLSQEVIDSISCDISSTTDIVR